MPALKDYVKMIQEGRAGEVRERLEAAVSSDPGYVAVHAVLAMAYDADGLLEEAVPIWERAHRLAPDSPSITEGMRRALRRRLLQRVSARLEATAEMLVHGTAPLVVAEPEPEASVSRPPAIEAPPAPEITQAAIEAPPAPDDAQPAAAPAIAPWQTLDEQVEVELTPQEPLSTEQPVPEPPRITPEIKVPPAIDQAEADLDELIRELESARIVPDPTIKPVEAAMIEPDVEDVVSETLARIYSNQRFYEEAAAVYDKLASQQPARAEEFRKKASEIRGRIKR